MTFIAIRSTFRTVLNLEGLIWTHPSISTWNNPGNSPCLQHGWRVHGILVRDLFYIVWVDPEHQLFPRAPGRPA